MNIIQRIKLLMYRVVKSFLNLNVTITGNLPGYQENYTKLDNNISLIEATSILQSLGTKGASDLKKTRKKALADLTYSIACKLVAYANNERDMVLLQEISFTKSELETANDDVLLDSSTIVLNRATDLGAELSDYGVIPAVLTSLLSAINAFRGAIPLVRDSATGQKTSTATLVTLFKETDQVLDNIDKIIKIVSTSESVFYNSYMDKRKLPDKGNSILSLRGIVKDSVSGMSIKGVTLVITLDGANNPDGSNIVIIKKSADKGGFQLKDLLPGNYHIKASKYGYLDQETTVAVNDGEMSVVEILMKKS